MPQIGTLAPTFNLLDTNRKLFSSDQLRGKTAILAFFPAAFSSVCEKELCTFRDSFAALNQSNATVVGISVDSPFANAAFAQKNKLEFPLLSDHRRNVVRAYGVDLENFAGMEGYTASKRAIFIVDAQGILRYQWVGENPGIEPNYEEVIAAAKKI